MVQILLRVGINCDTHPPNPTSNLEKLSVTEPSKSTAVKEVSKLGLASVLAQLILVTFIPVIGRFVPPNEFGQYSTLIAFTSIFAFMGAFKYENAFFLTKSARSEIKVSTISLTACLINAFIGALVFFLFAFKQLELPRSDFTIVFLVILAQSITVSFSAHLSATGDFRRIAVNRVIRSVVMVVVWGAGILLLSDNLTLAMYLGAVAGAMYTAITYSQPAIVNLVRSTASTSTFRTLKIAAIHKKFLIFESPAMLMSLAARNGLVILTAAFFGPVEAGLVGMSNLAVTKPLSVALQSISRVSQNRYARALRNNNFLSAKKIVLITSGALIILALLLGSLIILLSQPLTFLLLGAQWRTLPAILLTVTPRLIGIAVVRPIQRLLTIRKKQFAILVQETCGSIAALGGFTIGFLYSGELVFSLWVSSISTFAIYVLAFAWSMVALLVASENTVRVEQ